MSTFNLLGLQTRVLVGDSVYENALLTTRDGVLYVEFVSDEIDDLAIPLQFLPKTGGQMSQQLQGDQYPKGLSEEEVRTIAREETVRVLDKLGEELSNGLSNSDGPINGEMFLLALQIVIRKITAGE